MENSSPPSATPQALDVLSPMVKQQIAEMIAAHEIALENLATREKALAEQQDAVEDFLNTQIEKINALVADIRDIITETGAARLRLSTQEALKLGESQLSSLRQLCESTRQSMQESCTRFDRTANSIVKNLTEAVGQFKIEEFRDFVEKSYDQIKNAATTIMQKMAWMLRWFQWKNMAFGLGIAVMTAVFMGLYLNDEWPWEMHQEVIKQRAAGKALMNAWPHLSMQDQQYLQKKILQANTAH